VRAHVALHALKRGEALHEGARGGSRTPRPPPPGRLPPWQSPGAACGTQRLVRIPEAPVRRALPRPVAHLLSMMRAVLDRPGKGPQRLVRAPEVPVRLARPVAYLLGNRQALRVVLNRPGKVPGESYTLPRFPYAVPSPARSPRGSGSGRARPAIIAESQPALKFRVNRPRLRSQPARAGRACVLVVYFCLLILSHSKNEYRMKTKT
jgi:hypothetical protein